MHISFGLSWFFGDKEKQTIEEGLLRLLVAIKNQGSLKSAAEETRLSYRHAWGLIKKWEASFDSPLVTLQRGRNHGASLTSLGEKLVQAQRMVSDKFNSEYQAIADEVSLSLQTEIKSTTGNHLRISASHGMAINFLNQLLQANNHLKTELDIHGSLESLRLLNQASYDIAGFHYPLGNLLSDSPDHPQENHLEKISKILAPRYRQYLNPDRYDLLLVATREQGMITDASNSAKVTMLSDLTMNAVKFINRQHDSGTRTILDQLLASSGINANEINGYGNEEFTHVAVAAMIASGAANVGFGIKAACNQFGLNFIPILKEAYVIAVDKAIPNNLRALLKDTLKSDQFITKVNSYPGYDATNAGKKLDAEKLLTNRNINL